MVTRANNPEYSKACQTNGVNCSGYRALDKQCECHCHDLPLHFLETEADVISYHNTNN